MTDGAMIRTPIDSTIVRGAAELEATPRGVIAHRLPALARAQFDDPQLAMAQSHPSGVRLAFRTRAQLIELDAVPTKRVYTGLPARPGGHLDLRVDGVLTRRLDTVGGDVITVDMATGTVEHNDGDVGTHVFDGLAPDAKTVEIWLPHNEGIELTELRTDAPVEPVNDDRPVWVHYGSSISQGSNAVGPSTTWPALASAIGDVQLVNMGFGGGALLDQFVARAIRQSPAELISLEIGINIVNSDVMRLRAFTSAVHGFLDTVRDGHPTTTLLVISPLLCPIHEITPGPGAFDPVALSHGRVEFMATGDPAEVNAGKLTLTVVREELSRIVAQRAAQDPNLHYLDGRELYGDDDLALLPLPDQLHPDPATHELIARRFALAAFLPSPVRAD